MPLSRGDKLGPYEIVSPIGAGGMGEVYKARDMRLDRLVAIKVSNAEFSERFEREARAVAALNHPNICQLYDVGPNYLVMEYIDGEPLKGPLPLGQALRCAAQICDALHAAHSKGITHRDLKPANILVTKAGIKLLDFGLAKFRASETGQAPKPGDATLTMALTGKNQIVGTLYYMSPEQLQSQSTELELDGRSDIFSFGLVLYELLTGKRAIEGASSASVIAAIMERPAPSIADVAPAALDRALKRCLEKDPENRWQTARDLKAELDWIANAPAEGPSATPPLPARFKWLWPGVAGLLALAAVAALWAWAARTPLERVPTRLSVLVPANRPVIIPGSPTRSLAISPDGTQLVYLAGTAGAAESQTGVETQGRLQLRRLDSLEVRDLPGTEGARQPFFSPDGHWVAFFVDRNIRKISLSGGKPVTVAEKVTDAPPGASGVWAEESAIVFGATNTGLYRVSPEGGAATSLTTLDVAAGERSHSQASLVPNSGAVLFTVYRGAAAEHIDGVKPDSGKRTLVLANAHAPLVLSSGHLIFERNSELFIAPFDARRLAVTGPSLPLGEQIRYDRPGSPSSTPEMSVSLNGTFAYLPAVDTAGALGLVGRDGVFKPLGLPSGTLDRPRVSPDGRSLAYLIGGDLHLSDLTRGSTVKMTQDGRDEGAAWHPDGRSMAIASRRTNGSGGIFLRKPDGSEQVLVPLTPGVTFLRNFSWSSSGKLAYTVQEGSQTNIWILTPGEKPPTQAFIKDQAKSPKFSPDGKWLAYDSNESGRREVYLQRFPEGERLEVSKRGGDGPVWRSDGRELFFHGYTEGAQKKALVVSVTPNGASLRLGQPVALFDLRTKGPAGEEWQYSGLNSNSGADYDILPDGRFVMVRSAAPADIREIVVVQNWFEVLKRRVPVK